MTSRASRGQPFFRWVVAVAKKSLRSRQVTRSMVVILSDTATLLARVKPVNVQRLCLQVRLPHGPRGKVSALRAEDLGLTPAFTVGLFPG